MNQHLSIEESEYDENKLLAQNFGIAFAKTTFEDMLNIDYQGFLFSWDSTKVLEPSKNQLALYFEKQPDNIEELKNIAFKSSVTEYQSLKDSYKGELPLNHFTKEETISNLVLMTTKNFLSLQQSRFYKQERNKNTENLNEIWKEKFLETFTVESLRKIALERFNEVVIIKNVDTELEKIALNKFNDFWNSMGDLKERLG